MRDYDDDFIEPEDEALARHDLAKEIVKLAKKLHFESGADVALPAMTTIFTERDLWAVEAELVNSKVTGQRIDLRFTQSQIDEETGKLASRSCDVWSYEGEAAMTDARREMSKLSAKWLHKRNA